MIRVVALFLTVLTGFSALVYQVAWQKYLAALLGSHSEATAAVLGIFLGGLSVGYALFGAVAERRIRAAGQTGRPARLLLLYGVVEAVIGLYALGFSALFGAARAASLHLPHASPGMSFAADVALTAALIGPPAVLMGGTIPLLTQALTRGLGDATRLHALIYACNTLGAFAGALSAGFYLVPALGLRGCLVAMALVNLVAGVGFVLLQSRVHGVADPAGSPEPAASPSSPQIRTGLAVALLSGFAMMTLQVVANRVGAFSLGSSQFTFSMVVAVFVLGIALGSLAVTALRSIPRLALPLSQWLLVALLLALYFSVDDAPYYAHRIRVGFSTSPAEFFPYQASVFGWLLAVSVPWIALSGATLPLIFHDLRRELGQLGSLAGRIYAWNTVGSLAGALLGGYASLFWLDLHEVYRLAVAVLVVGAWALCERVGGTARNAGRVAAVAVLAVIVLLPAWSPKQLSSGLFRRRTPMPHTGTGPETFFRHYNEERPSDYVVFYRDDPSASVAVTRFPRGDGTMQAGVVTNGKSDSAIPVDNRTTGLIALLPALFAENPQRAFVVGIGTGMTASRLSRLPSVEQVDVAEISQAMIDALAYLDDLNGGVLANPKIEVRRGDAYRALTHGDARYDVIVSEPSNPWIAGVELLYTQEFLASARERLRPGGVYGQWFHSYEADREVVSIILRTFRSVFESTSVWITQKGDLLLLGTEDLDRLSDVERVATRFESPAFLPQFEELGIRTPAQLLVSELLPPGVLEKMDLPGPLHTLEDPILSDRAARAFFVGQPAELPPSYFGDAAETGRRNALLGRHLASHPEGRSTAERVRQAEETCATRPRSHCSTSFAHWLHQEPQSEELARIIALTGQTESHKYVVHPDLMHHLAVFFGDRPVPATLTYDQAEAIERLYERYYNHATPFRADVLDAIRAACTGDPRCPSSP